MRYVLQFTFALMMAFALLAVTSLPNIANAAGESYQSITVDGTLYSDPTLGTPLFDAAANLTISIYNPAGNCLIYEEQQNVNTMATAGKFNIEIGSTVADPGAKRTGNDAGNAMLNIFQNVSAIAGTGAGCPWTPSAGDERLVRITLDPTVGGPVVMTPDMKLTNIPNALVCESVQGLDRSKLIEIGPLIHASATQANFINLINGSDASALHNHDSDYAALNNSASMTMASQTTLEFGEYTNGQQTTLVGTLGAADAGKTWYNSDTDQLMYWNGAIAQAIGSGGGGTAATTTNTPAGDIAATDVQAALNELDSEKLALTGGTMSGVINMGSNLITNVTDPTNAQEAATKNYVDNAITTNNGSYVAKAGDNMTGALTLDAQNELRLADDAGGDYISFKAPAGMSSNYDYTLPANYGTNGHVLTTDGAGGLTWQADDTGGGAGTLDQSYDQGGAGAGRTITVDTGAVQLTGSNAADETLEVTNSGNGGAMLIENTGTGDSLRINDEAADTSPIVFDDAGNIGVGTASPATMLHLRPGESDGLRIENSVTPAFRLDLITDTSLADAKTEVIGYSGLKLKSTARMYYESTGGPWANQHWFKTTNPIAYATTNAQFVQSQATWAPTSGPGDFLANLNQININQTGTASGNYIAQKIMVTETAVLGTQNKLIDAEVGGTSQFIVTSDGNVGIGPGGYPSESLVVTKSTGNALAQFNSYGGVSTVRLYKAGGTVGTPTAVTNGTTIGQMAVSGRGATTDLTSSAAKISFVADENWTDATGAAYMTFNTRAPGNTASSVERMRIEPNGYIGINTNAPTSRLDVDGHLRIRANALPGSPQVGTIAIDSGDSNKLKYYDGAWRELGIAGAGNNLDSAYDEGGAGAGRTITADTGAVLINGSNAADEALEVTQSGNGGGMLIENTGTGDSFRVNDEAADTSPFAIDSDGNVGVGTTTPIKKLDVRGGGDDETSAAINVYNGSNTANAAAVFTPQSFDSSGTIGAYPSAYINANLADRLGISSATNAAGLTLGASSATGNIRMYTGGWNERLVITDAGNVGIGIATPGAELDVGTGDIMISSAGVSPSRIVGSENSNKFIALEDGAGLGHFSTFGGLRISVSATEVARFDSNGALQMGSAASANASAIMDLVSTSRGFLGPRMDGTQRDAIASPAAGLQIYNTDTNQLNFHNGTSWQVVGVAGGGNNLDAAYDEGGAGAGRTITADTGAVLINGSNATDEALEVTQSGNGGGMLVENTGTGDSFRVNDEASDTSPFVVKADGKVGIGATNPPDQLSVHGDVTANPAFMSISATPGEAGRMRLGWPGSAAGHGIADNVLAAQINVTASGSLVLSSRTNTASNMIFYTNAGTDGLERMRISSTGDVGIGLTNPASKLEVAGDISTARTNKFQFLENAGGGGRAYIRSTENEFPTDFNGLVFAVGAGTEVMHINSSGNVGIGQLTPTAKLHVDGNAKIGSAAMTTIGSDSRDSSYIELHGDDNAGAGPAAPTGDNMWIKGIKQSGVVKIMVHGPTGGEIFTVEDSGEVGIGTVAPGGRLHVRSGELILDGTGAYLDYKPNNSACADGEVLKWVTANDRWECGTDSTGGGSGTLDASYDVGGAGAGRAITVDTGAVQLTGSNAADETLEVTNSGNGGVALFENTGTGDSFRVNDEAADASPFLIDASGNVGIGTTTPNRILDIRATDASPVMRIRNNSSTTTQYPQVVLENYKGTTSGYPAMTFRNLRGSVGSAAAIQANDQLGFINFSGYGDTSNLNGAYIASYAASNWTDSNSESNLRFYTADNGSTAPVEHLRITGDGGTIIGGAGTNPVASAQLQIDSTAKGFLPPRMTTAQRTGIGSPAEGLIVFDTNEDSLYVYQNAAWAKLANSTEVSFHVHRNGVNQTVAANTNVKVDFTTEMLDISGAFDTTTDRFQPTVPGRYFIHFQAHPFDATTLGHALIYKNGAALVSGFQRTNAPVPHTSFLVDMNGTTDYLEFYAHNGGGTTLSGNTGYTFAQGFLISGGTGGGGGGADHLGNHTASQNIVLGSHYLSGDGDNEGIQIDASGNVSLAQNLTLTGTVDMSGATIADNSIALDDLDFGSSTGGINIPQLAADPGSATEGQMYYNTVSDVLKVYADGAWTEVRSGGGGTEVAFRINSTAARTLNADNLLMNATEDIALNTGSAYNSTTHTFTAPSDGTYLFIGEMHFSGAQNNSAVYPSLRIDPSTGNQCSNSWGAGGSNGWGAINVTCLLPLNTSDTVQLIGGKGGSSTNLNVHLYRFAGFKLGEGAETTLTVADADADTKIQVEESADEDFIRFDTAGTERMVINNTGNVGIGTSAPSHPFDVHADSARIKSLTGNGSLYLEDQDNSSRWAVVANDAGQFSIWDAINSQSPLVIEQNTPNNSVYVDSTGNVGIGIANSPHKFYVNEGLLYATRTTSVDFQSVASFYNPAVTGQGDNHTHIGYRIANDEIWNFFRGDGTNIEGDLQMLSGNVGIGISDPQFKLQVYDGSTGLSFDTWDNTNTDIDGLLPGTAFGTRIINSNDSHMVFALRDNDALDGFHFITGGGNYTSDTTYDTTAMSILASGSVGIGTSSPSGALDVRGVIVSETDDSIWENFTAIQYSDSKYPQLLFKRARGTKGSPSEPNAGDVLGQVGFRGTSDNGGGEIQSLATENHVAGSNRGGSLRFRTTANGATAASVRMTIANDGKVGVGTTSPANTMQIAGSTFHGLSISASSGDPFIQFHTSTDGGNTISSVNDGWTMRQDQSNADVFQWRHNNTARVSFTTAGNVGIGVANPTHPLEVRSSWGVLGLNTSAVNQDSGVQLKENNTLKWHMFNDGSSNDDLVITRDSGGNTTGDLILQHTGGTVGVGLTTPEKPLHVYQAGSDTAGPFRVQTGGDWVGIGLKSNQSKTVLLHYGSSFREVRFGRGNASYTWEANPWRLDIDNGNVWITGTLSQSSDIRLKKNLTLLDGSLQKVLTLNGYTYQWIEESKGTETQLGVIAQEVEKVFPEAVDDDENGIKSVSYQNLIAPIIESIKELYAKWFEDHERINALEEENKEQDREISSLKDENQQMRDYLCGKDPEAPFCQ